MEPVRPFPASSPPNGGASARFLHAILGIVAVLALALAIWPGLTGLVAPRGEPIDTITLAPTRIAAFVTLAVVMGLRLLTRPGKRPSKTSVAWESFANETGGSFTEQRRSLTPRGWEGGPSVAWSVRGCPLKLTTVTESGGTVMTTLIADRELSRGFQFQLCRQNFLTKALMSPKVWQVVLAGVKQGSEAEGTADERERLAAQLSFLTGTDVVIGDPEFDGAFILKTDDEAKARDFFADAGVRHWLRELTREDKGWMLSLQSGGGAAHQLTLKGSGMVREAEALKAAHALMASALERLEPLCGAPAESRRIAS